MREFDLLDGLRRQYVAIPHRWLRSHEAARRNGQLPQGAMKQEFLTDVQFGRLVARAWQDDDFRKKLEADPTATIQAFAREVLGIEVEYPIYMPPRPADLTARLQARIGWSCSRRLRGRNPPDAQSRSKKESTSRPRPATS